jgi:ABC-type multidrug transport system permease subunit
MMMSQIYGELVKKFTLWRRRPIWAILGLFAPLGISTFIIASFATMAELPVWQIGLVDEDNTAQSQVLKEAILFQEGTMPYYQATTDDRAEAISLFDEGRLYMVVTIPEGFGDKLNAGEPVAIDALISNAHADQTKNLRLGLDARLYLFYQQYMLPASDRPGVVYTYSLTYPTEIPRAGYMATGALVLTIMLTAMMYAALFAALEHQEKTAMEVETPPRGSLAGMIGSILAAMVESFIILAIIFIINGLLWHLKIPPVSALPQVLLAVVLLAMIFAIIGYGLGQKARDVRLVLGPTMIIVLTLWIMSGGVNPVEAMAGTELLSLLPTTATLKLLAKEMVGLETISAGTNMLIIGAWSAAIVVIALVLKIGIKRRF